RVICRGHAADAARRDRPDRRHSIDRRLSAPGGRKSPRAVRSGNAPPRVTAPTLMLIVRGQRVVLPDGEGPASIHIDRGVIAEVRDYADVEGAAEIVDADPLVILPGLVDCHVQVNEPGRTDWEGFETATRAAAAGGITTLIDMPLNSIPAT